jgi:ADP-ribose pyrophosphatase
LEEVDLETPGGETSKRTVIRMGGAVAVVAVVDDEVILIRQYRTPFDRPILELPAGKLDIPGEDPMEAARRELAEEAGYLAENLELLAQFYTSPGFVDEEMTIYLASGLTATEMNPIGPEEVAAELVRVPMADVPSLLPEIEDAKTVVGLMGLLLKRAQAI